MTTIAVVVGVVILALINPQMGVMLAPLAIAFVVPAASIIVSGLIVLLFFKGVFKLLGVVIIAGYLWYKYCIASGKGKVEDDTIDAEAKVVN